MKILNFEEFITVHHLINQIKYQTVLQTILSGDTSGVLYVNNKETPTVAFAQFKQRTFLSGDPNLAFREQLKNFFSTRVQQHCQEFDVPYIRLTVNNPQWLNIVKIALEARDPLQVRYQIYEKQITKKIDDFIVPDNFEILPVNRKLMDQTFPGKRDLLEEMCSERESVESFLDKSFGVAAFHNGFLAGWCLSEYNYDNRCEVGIASLPPFQRIGLAKAMTHQFSNQALQLGVEKILWHCFESNKPSRRTAVSTGFTLVDSHDVLILYWDPALNLAVNGNVNFERGNFKEALNWYKKALDQENPLHWMAVYAACSAAHLNQLVTSFHHLNQALDLGYDDLDYLVNNDHLTPLKSDPRWGEIITRINQILISKS